MAWADVEPGALSTAARAELIAEGVTFANFDNGVHKSRNDGQFFLKDAVILAGPDAAAAAPPAPRRASRSTPPAC